MGFRNGGYMTVWEIQPGKSQNYKTVRISSRRKNKMSGEYEDDFSGFAALVGEANLMADKLHERSRIRIGECEVTTRYVKETGKEYINYTIYSFTIEPSKFDNEGTASSGGGNINEPQPNVEDLTEDEDDDDVPF